MKQLRRYTTRVRLWVLRAAQWLGISQSEAAVTQAATRYWSGEPGGQFRRDSHWQGTLEEADWLELGRQHLELFHSFAGLLGVERPVQRVVEWGCGGGANAVHFAQEAEAFVGVDVSQASLDECARQLERAGLGERFQPVLIDLEHPERATAQIETCDLYLCTYVFELIPGPEYAERLLAIARDLLRPGGAAVVQVKYATNNWRTRPHNLAYRLNAANTTTFRIEAFWQMAEAAGLEPKAVTLVPQQPLINDERYAYFLLVRPR